MERNAVGIEILRDYFELAQKSVKPIMETRPAQLALLEEKRKYAPTKPK
jgi:hypothetical protein